MSRIHIVASVAALIVGAIIAWLPKGTRLHRTLGWSYVLATGAYAGVSFGMYPSTGRITPFHAIAVQSIGLVALGVGAARARYRGVGWWRVWHLRFMLYSYVALVATGLRFALPYVKGIGLAGPLIVFTLVPLCGWWWIERRVVRRLARPSVG